MQNIGLSALILNGKVELLITNLVQNDDMSFSGWAENKNYWIQIKDRDVELRSAPVGELLYRGTFKDGVSVCFKEAAGYSGTVEKVMAAIQADHDRTIGGKNA